MIDVVWVLRGFEGLTLVAGSLVAFQSLRAYSRTRETSLALLGIGFLFVSLAAALAGVLYELLTHDLATAWTVSAALDSAGFLVILYSILRQARSLPASEVPMTH